MTDLSGYYELLAAKAERTPARGLDQIPALDPSLFPHQRASLEFLLAQGSGGAFLDTGLGKTRLALEWGRVVAEHTDRPVLMLAPLAVGHQHVAEARAMGHDDVREVRDQVHVGHGVNIANYEMLKAFEPSAFGGLILDESSILKSFTGSTTRALMAFGEAVPYRLACTATPAPNDVMELGQHAQFLGVMRSAEMLTRFFIADQSEMGRYRLKRPVVERFWNWMASWSRCVSKPSDLGFDDTGYDLPPLDVLRHIVHVDQTIGAKAVGSQLSMFRRPDLSSTGIHAEKRLTAPARARAIAERVNDDRHEQWAVWCDTDYEAVELMACIPDAIEVSGGQHWTVKERGLKAFSSGAKRVIVTKPRIAGFGLNWQHCARIAAVGVSYSYEQYYQLIRRCWRFGQRRAVQAHFAMGETEVAQWDVVMRKQGDHEHSKAQMAAAMRRAHEVRGTLPPAAPAVPVLPAWMIGG